MPKTTTAKTTKTATKAAVDKKTKPKADDTKPKEKREPTAWDKFRKEENQRLKDNEPGLDAETRRKQVSETWLNHVDNPNRGKPRKPRAPKKKKDAEKGERPEREPATDSSSLPPSSPMTSSP
ncbi:hypothetical protein PENSPDRAFT_755888 [Peniophora sp. CONT]|nr:hypothetical protein PENSPDRAFT_755888 [Peniophora sp. CONT]